MVEGIETARVACPRPDETVTMIEIKQGLKPGEQVAEKPLELLSNLEQSKRGQRKGVDRRADGKSDVP